MSAAAWSNDNGQSTAIIAAGPAGQGHRAGTPRSAPAGMHLPPPDWPRETRPTAEKINELNRMVLAGRRT